MLTERNHLFDNLKGILILLVVFGHTFEKYIGQHVFPYSFYGTLYSFHMPLFIFISGYFTKNADKARETAFSSLLIPYLVFNTLYNIIESLIHQRLVLSIISPGWTLWYLLSLFTMKIVLKDVLRIKYSIPFFILLGVVIGRMHEFGYTLSISRTVCFMPFFLMGYYANENTIQKIRSIKVPLIIASILLLAGVCFFWIIMFTGNSPVKLLKMLYMSGSYIGRDLSPNMGMFTRAMQYAVAILPSCALIALTPARKINWLAQMGQHTLAIYIGHIYILMVLYRLIPNWNTNINGQVLLCISPFIIAWVLSLPVFTQWMNRLLNTIRRFIITDATNKS